MEAALVAGASRFMFKKVTDLLQLDKELKAMMGTKKKMQNLKELSTIIDAMIQDVESRPSIDDAVKDLLMKLKYLSYDLEDVVDYYETKVFQKKQRSKTYLRLMCDFFSSDNQVVFKNRVGGMIKAIKESLDYILLQRTILLTLPPNSIRMSEPSLNRVTHACNSFVIGREPEKNKIVHMLTQEDDDDESINHGTVKVIAIIGMGGLGKTTLAQHVFNDEKVEAHFASSRMWTVVGVEFDPANIMKSVLELATGAPVNISEIDLVRQNLKKALSGKKFLLVLDDIWNENESKWNVLKEALTCGARGSKILVTTRSQQVSLIMGSPDTTHQIQQLSRDDCLSLFQQSAFRDQAVDQNLMEIGAKIVEKCGGVPLAAISLGSMFSNSRDETYWSSILKSEIWQLENEKDKLLAVLKLSYDTLPPRSKKCFAFASLFPRNYRMAKAKLIKLWIANGFVRSEGNVDAETNGNLVFNDLVMGSFLLPASHKFEYVTKCTMHDLMYDLARSVSTDVYWNSDQDSVENIGKRIYHLPINPRKFPNMTQVVLGKKPLYLRTFMPLYTFSHLNINLLEVFSKMKFLRVLNLTDGGIEEVPTSIGNLIHLRYLNLSKNGITVLPDSITLLSNLWFLNLSRNGIEVLPDSIILLPNLRYLNLSENNFEILPDSITLLPNLWYLNLSSNCKLQELPKELGNMQNLRNLNLEGNYGLTHMPCGLSQLTNLRSLPFFVGGDKTGSCSIIELENLKLHGEMEIKFSDNFKNYSCGRRKILKNKDLNELCVKFNDSERYDKDMLDDLCPKKTSLEKLDIQYYGSPQFPTWLIELQLPNLIEVSLKNCHVCEHIPPFGNLKSLKKLSLESMANITQMGVEFHGYGGFPSLQELSLNQMDNLEEWSESHVVDQLFPLLQRLLISNCPYLKSMPRFPRIQELGISCCSKSIVSCIGKLTSLSVLKVKNMDDITSLPSDCIRNLTSLTTLEITECRQLQSLLGDERCYKLASFSSVSKVRCLSSLCCLRLSDCPSMILQSEEHVQILNSVDKFQIHICGNKVNLRGQLQYLHALKKLSLCGSHVTNNYKIGCKIRILSICCCDELESLMTAEAASITVLEKLSIDGISNLTVLPDWLQHLNFLCALSIKNCPQLERVPRDLKNLPMLKTLKIVDCPQLKSRCKRETGEDWLIISNVPNVDIK